MKTFIQQLIERKHAFSALITAELKLGVAGTRFGVLWWVLDPLILMGVYFFLIKIVFDRGGPDFHVFALCGIVCFQYFSRSLTGCTKVLMANQGLIKQTDLPLVIYVLIQPVAQGVYCLFGILVILLFVPYHIGLHTILLIPLIFLVALITITCGLYLSVLNVYIRDTSNFIRYAVRLVFFLSPVLYGPERIYESDSIPAIVKTLYALNPLASIIPAFRTVLLEGNVYDIKTILIIFIITLLFFQTGLIYFRKTEGQLVKML